MKKALFKFILIIVVIFLTVYYNDSRNTIGKDLSFFNDEKIKENPSNDLEKYLNNLLISKNEIEDLSCGYLKIDDLNNLDKSLNKEQDTYNKLPSIDFDISKEINDYSEKEQKEILSVFNKSDVVKNKTKYEEKLKECKVILNEDINLLNYLKNKQNDYYIRDDKLYYKNDEIGKILKESKNDINFLKEKIVNIPILMYHGVLDNPKNGAELFVKISDFKKQMNYLKENNFTPIFLSEISEAGSYEKPVLITFDDGYVDVYENAFPILQENKFKFNFYLISDWIGGSVYVTKDMVLEMNKSQFVEIGSHTATHRNLASLNQKEVDEELKNSKETLEKLLEKKINTIAYPYGGHNNMVMEIASKYYDYALATTTGKEVSDNLKRYELNRYYIKRSMSLDDFIDCVN